jgi:Tfp pilus assembly protein PilF
MSDPLLFILSQDGDFKKALKAFEDILASLVGAYGKEHHRVGAALHNVGIANLRAGKLDDAMTSIEEAVRMRKKTLGDSHPKVAVSMMNEWRNHDLDSSD